MPPTVTPATPAPSPNGTKLSGPEKAAALLLGLDEAVAALIIKQLSPEELRRLMPIVDKLPKIELDELDVVYGEFTDLMQRPALPTSGGDYMRKLAASAIGADEFEKVLSPPVQIIEPKEALKSAPASALAELLADEHPQVAAVILSQLPRAQAAGVLLALSEEMQGEVLARVGELKEIPLPLLEAASEVLAKAIEQSGVGAAAAREFDGIEFAAGLLNEIGGVNCDRLLQAIESDRADLVPKLREAMFTFEDLGRLDKRELAMLMREVSGDQLRIALRQASEALRERFLSSVSVRVADEIRDDLANMPPVRLSEVESAQRAVVEAALSLAAEGKIKLPTGDDEAMV
jgi:flagellar motor switch protein FliG